MTTTTLQRLHDAVSEGRWDRVEELWLEALEISPLPVAALLEERRTLWQEGQKTLGWTLLELLADAAEERGDANAPLAAVREMVRLSEKPSDELRARLEEALVRARAASPGLARVIDHLHIRDARRPLEVLEAAEQWLDHDAGAVVEVVGQGVGRVVDINLELETVKVDTGGARPLSIPFGALPRFVRRLEPGTFLHRKVVEPDALREMAAADPGRALVELLESFDEPVEVAALRAALEGVVPADGWSSWWNKARKHPRIVHTGSGSRLRYGVTGSAADATAAVLDDLRAARGRERLQLARRAAARGPEAVDRAAEVLREDLPGLESSDRGLAWETAVALAELGDEGTAAAARERLLDGDPLALLGGVEDRPARAAALDGIRDARPDDWPEVWGAWMLHEEHPSVLDHIAGSLGGRHDAVLDSALEAIFRDHLKHAAGFVWACEAMVRPDAPEPLRQRFTPSILERIPDFLTRKDTAPLRARSKALLDGGQVAIRLILEAATPQQAERFAARVQRVDTVEPARQRLLEQAVVQRAGAARAPEAPPLVATRAAVDGKRAELKQLLDVDIPKTLKGINAAAAEGDLRENFEYHMLRDRQELQSARAAKLQQELGQVRILEPGAADTSLVNIGTVVHLEDFAGSPLPPVTIMGPWDADVEQRIFAAGTELAQGLLGRAVGDEVELEGRPARIVRIEAWR